MGPCNENNEYLFDEEIDKAHWFRSQETGLLHIIPREGDGFEPYGPDDEDAETLLTLSEETLQDEYEMASHGFDIVHPPLRRHSKDVGFYSA